MLAFIRRHQAWGFIFIALVIISFVVFFAPTSRYDSGSGMQGRLPDLYGEPVSQEEFISAAREAELALTLQYGANADAVKRQINFDAGKEALRRIVLWRKIRQLNIEVSDQAVADRIRQFEAFQDPRTKEFDFQRYERQLEGLTAGSRDFSRVTFEDYIRHELGREQLMEIAGLAGEVVPPGDAAINFREENEQTLAQVVVFSSSNYLAKATLDPESLAQFYTNHQATYRVPKRLQVCYVKFSATNFLAEAEKGLAGITNLDLNIEQFYQQQDANSFRDDQGNVLSPEAAKAKIKDQQRNVLALGAASKAANAFANELYKMPYTTNSLPKLAADKGLEWKVSEPFSQNEPPADMQVSFDFARRAFALEEAFAADKEKEAPFTTPVRGDGAVYVYALWATQLSYVPDLDSIRPRVVEDFRRTRARELARNDGNTLANTVTNALAQGKSFEAVCLEAKVVPITLPPFTERMRSLPELPSGVSLNELQAATSELQPGQATGFRTTFDGGFLACIKERKPVDEEKLKKELPAYMAELRRTRQFVAFNDWFSHEVERAGLKLTDLQPTAAE